VQINEATRAENHSFFPPGSEVPTHAVTMGLGTLMDSRSCMVLAFGARKAPVLAGALQGSVTAELPASLVQQHPDTVVFLDRAAAAELRRRDTRSRTAGMAQPFST
jgi:glucosamine-6-phosphate deaminase